MHLRKAETGRLPRAALENLAGAFGEHEARLLAEYVGMVVAAGQRMNLVSRSGLGRIWEHVVDSAALLSFLDCDDGALADLGSGGGLPGVPVAILRPRMLVSLVESRRRKAAFLRRVRAGLGLKNLDVVECRVENLWESRLFPLAVSRALGSIDETLVASLRVVAPGGRLVLFKGPGWKDEAARAAEIAQGEGAAIGRVEEIALPGMGRSTVFVEFHVKQAA
jgi:16S rRNA (guanine527-N7)-methyltransferase